MTDREALGWANANKKLAARIQGLEWTEDYLRREWARAEKLAADRLREVKRLNRCFMARAK